MFRTLAVTLLFVFSTAGWAGGKDAWKGTAWEKNDGTYIAIAERPKPGGGTEYETEEGEPRYSSKKEATQQGKKLADELNEGGSK